MRQLASIQSIQSLQPAPGFDRLAIAKILGWQALVKKDEFKEGDSCIYIEYDSILPERPEFEFLRPRKFRIKTLKMRGTISQGLVLPVSYIQEKYPNIIFQEGDDVTELMGIIKYEIPENQKMQFARVRNWPAFIPKTDETRLQSIPHILDELEGQEYYVTLKEDGSSATYYINEDHFGVCSRNLEASEYDEKNAYWKCAKLYDIEHKLRQFQTKYGMNIALQGEITGPGMDGSGVYKNPMKHEQLTFHIFNIYDIDKMVYLDYDRMVDIINELELTMVHILEIGETERSLSDWIEFATTFHYPSGQPAEGIVVRPMWEQYSSTIKGRFSFKVINNLYLLSEK